MNTITNGQAYKVSNSEIQVFKDCRRKWWLTYYRRLKPKDKKYTGPLALGSRVHEALDRHYTSGDDLIETYNLLLAEDLLAIEEAEMFIPDNFGSEGELGRIMLEGYIDWSDEEGINSDLELVSTEEILSMFLMDGTVELQGKLDMRVRRLSDGARLFRDWKTAISFTDFESTAQMNEQIMTYMLLEHANNPDPETRSMGGIFTLFRKVKRTASAKPPFYKQFEVNHNVFTMRSFWERIHGELNDLMALKNALDSGASHRQVAYPRPSRDCTWKCDFYSICTMFDDGSAVEEAVAERFEVSDPYDYYNSTLDKTKEGKDNG